MAKLLKEDPVFCEYEVILAAGDGKMSEDDETKKAYDRVKKAIAEHDKTITLTVGQLTVGVTIPEWSAVLMLCNLTSPSSYMQAAFRAQNPCVLTNDGKRLRKETAYVFDFDPARTLIIFDEFANNLIKKTAEGRGTTEDRKENIRRLLNFFPVIGEDSEGKMVELDAAQVLSIPRKLKSQEVVRRGFMSNFLFQNISNIFGAPSVVREILEKIDPAHEEGNKREGDKLKDIKNVPVDENGDVQIPNEIIIGKTQDLFGDKIYETIERSVEDSVAAVGTSSDFNAVSEQIKNLTAAVTDKLKQDIVAQSPILTKLQKVRRGVWKGKSKTKSRANLKSCAATSSSKRASQKPSLSENRRKRKARRNLNRLKANTALR